MSSVLDWLADDRDPADLEADLYHSTAVCYDYQSASVIFPYSYTSPQEVAPGIWKIYDPTSGHFFYYSQMMGETCWSDPLNLSVARHQS